ncbi:hypothetical protein WA1_12200 [Scytonema hofmannii PCC 7110]|uniref:Uncharacterized protein n=1 Tax=Scytonema hofmannii PCC 7110 TaxID=128403 RepID=A0A139XDX3_9CYAN|nr:hypothetical protein [Scytonema hofmannii]KYC42876.1 hypothetical protein WA1_12200 [Scytonema hofmannii PCC 7110]
MKKTTLLKGICIAFFSSLFLSNASWAGEAVQISPNLQPDPLVVNGTSGGKQESNCGKIAEQPSQVIKITKALPYLRLTVESGGKPTLLIDGPGGRFCVLADSYSGGKPEISGFWQEGNYTLYVGELSQGQYSYRLSISQQKPNKTAK